VLLAKLGHENENNEKGNENNITASNSLDCLNEGLKTINSQNQYRARLSYFFDDLKLPGATVDEQATAFLNKGKQNNNWAADCVKTFIKHYKEMIENKKISSTTLTNYLVPVKFVCEMNDLELNWKRLLRGKPQPRSVANDRAPTIEEVRKLCEHSDRRIKLIAYIACSGGLRAGSWDYLYWKNVEPKYNADFLRWKKRQLASEGKPHDHIVITKDNEEKIIAAKLSVYAGEFDSYYTFLTPEAYFELKNYIDFRASFGEKITGDSPLLRDLWKTTNVKYAAKKSLATNPKRLNESAVKRMINRAIWKQGLRQPLPEGVRRHEWKTTHGFRKFFDTRCRLAGLNFLNVEKMMSHSTGLPDSYNKQSEYSILDDYLKAVDLLTIDINHKAASMLQKQVTQLTEKSDQTTGAIVKKLAQKDKEIEELKIQQDKISKEVELVYKALKMSQTRADFSEEDKRMQSQNPSYREAAEAADSILEQADLEVEMEVEKMMRQEKKAVKMFGEDVNDPAEQVLFY
jgi:integrase